jgi:hypothetical protein
MKDIDRAAEIYTLQQEALFGWTTAIEVYANLSHLAMAGPLVDMWDRALGHAFDLVP